MKLLLLLLLALAFIVAPMTMLRPRPEQRRREQLRMAARDLGLRFSMRRLPARKTDMEQAPAIPCYYLPPVDTRLQQEDWLLRRTAYSHEGNFYQEWDWEGSARPAAALQAWLLAQMPGLPANLVALVSGSSGTGILWNERACDGLDEAASLALLHQFLSAIQTQERALITVAKGVE